MAVVSNDADAIRQQMAHIRRELHADVREVVVKAEAAADWHRYLRLYPWVSVGAAFVAGYLVVPRRRRAEPPLRAAAVREFIEPAQAAERIEPKRRKGGLLKDAWGAVSPIAIRLAQGYAVQYLENWLLQQQQYATAPPPPPHQPSQTGSSGGTRSR